MSHVGFAFITSKSLQWLGKILNDEKHANFGLISGVQSNSRVVSSAALQPMHHGAMAIE